MDGAEYLLHKWLAGRTDRENGVSRLRMNLSRDDDVCDACLETFECVIEGFAQSGDRKIGLDLRIEYRYGEI